MNNINPIPFGVLIVAAGVGTRMGEQAEQTPKQFQPLLGMTVIEHTLRRLAQVPFIDDVYIAVQPDQVIRCQNLHAILPSLHILETGGATRQATVRQSLQAISQYADRPSRIAIHDAARPCWTMGLLNRLYETPSTAVVPALPVPDSMRRLNSDSATNVERTNIFMLQTPQVFAFDRLLALHQQYEDTPVTDDSALFEITGENVTYIPGERHNLKITTAADMADAAAILTMQCGDIRTATGYDVHQFITATPERPLKLGGISIQHDKTLKGHSDADVVLHAITDALLGCIAAQDIGHHFSPKDPRWKDADSDQFLAHARGLITARGGLITHIDTTIICEEPKIGPHRAAMQQAIADILKIDIGRVSVKATTSEGLGFTGRREGIAAQAAATVRLPFTIPSLSESKKYA